MKVASEVSTAASKANGGLIGPIDVKELSQTLQQLLDDDEAGEITAAAARRKGLPDPQARDEDNADSQALRERARLSHEKVYAERQRGEVRKFLDRLREPGVIEWKNEDLKKAYEQALERGRGAGGLASSVRSFLDQSR